MAEIGFNKLSAQLGKKKGVDDPKALAATIGRKKLGQKEMTTRAIAGKKK